jgi:hypothetical protein
VAADIDTSKTFECTGNHARFQSSSSSISLIAIKNGFPPPRLRRVFESFKPFKTFQLFRETGKQHGGELASHEATASEKQFDASVPRREMRNR